MTALKSSYERIIECEPKLNVYNGIWIIYLFQYKIMNSIIASLIFCGHAVANIL